MAISVLPISAQEQRIKEPEKISFKPHWFIQAQIGAAHTVGEAKFTDLISPAAALNVGYKFAPAFGARVGVSGWQAKGGWVNPQQTYQYKYLQGNVDIMADISTLFCGFNPKRVFNGYLFAGAGLNRGFDNDEANALDTRTYEMEYLWQEQPKPTPVAEKPQPKKEVVIEPMKQNIFFAINSAKIQDDQQAKIASLVEYLEKNATAKVSVTGYADKGTGNARINSKLSEKRANNVVEALKAKGIAADRITVAYKGDTVQPYNTPEENRVSICIAE